MVMMSVSNAAQIDEFLQKHQVIHALPENATQIMRMTMDANCNSADLVKVIEKDAALAAAIMKTVNSAFYSVATKMTRLDYAVSYLGMKTVKEVATSTVLSKMCKSVTFGTYSARDLWDHGISVAIVSRELAMRSKKFDAEEAFLAGILHDLGLMLASQSEVATGTELLTQAEAGNVPFAELEQRLFGFSHAELGAALAKKWAFPEPQAAAIQFHHKPDEAPEEYQALCKHLYLADTLACQTNIGCPLSAKAQTVTDDYSQAAGINAAMIDEVMSEFAILARLHLN